MYVCMCVCRGEPAGDGVLVSDSLPLHEGGVLRGDGAGAGPAIVPHRVRTSHTYIHTYIHLVFIFHACVCVCMVRYFRCGFRLPGEAQKIDRFVEVFVKTFWQVCTCMYVCTVCMYVYVCMYICMYMYGHVWTWILTNRFNVQDNSGTPFCPFRQQLTVRLHIRPFHRVYVCVYVCMYVCMYVCGCFSQVHLLSYAIIMLNTDLHRAHG